MDVLIPLLVNFCTGTCRLPEEYFKEFKGRHFKHQPFVDRCDEGLALETSAFKLLTVVNLRFQLSC